MTNNEKAKSLADQLKPCSKEFYLGFYLGFYQGVLVALNAVDKEKNEMYVSKNVEIKSTFCNHNPTTTTP